jgi:hypothetical protein
MGWLEWILVVLGGLVGFLIFNYFMGNPKFWRLVKDNPDAAYGLFLLSGCLVDRKPERGMGGKYTGPFRFLTSDGNTHVVYIQADELDDIQKKIAHAITSND